MYFRAVRVAPTCNSHFSIEQLRRERLSSNVLVVGVNFGGHFGGQNVQVSMGQNGMHYGLTSCVQSAEQIGSKKLAIGRKLLVTILFEPICSADCTQLFRGGSRNFERGGGGGGGGGYQ